MRIISAETTTTTITLGRTPRALTGAATALWRDVVRLIGPLASDRGGRQPARSFRALDDHPPADVGLRCEQILAAAGRSASHRGIGL